MAYSRLQPFALHLLVPTGLHGTLWHIEHRQVLFAVNAHSSANFPEGGGMRLPQSTPERMNDTIFRIKYNQHM